MAVKEFAAKWDGRVFVPHPNLVDVLAREIETGTELVLAECDERSMKSHRHFFAVVRTIFLNLPEGFDDRFQDQEHLRKFGLIRAGFADLNEIVASDEEQAERIAAVAQILDGYAIVAIDGLVVRIWRAKSMSYRQMGRRAFEEAHNRVLETLCAITGLDLDEMQKQPEGVSEV